MVETQHLISRSKFDRLRAAGRIRCLLDHIGVPTAVPTRMGHLPQLYDTQATDGPGVIAKVRNAAVHAKQGSRALLGAMDVSTWYECCELALSYLELALLSVCKHTGDYARRGWTGDDETRVPWG